MHVDFVKELGEVRTEVAGVKGTLTARVDATEARVTDLEQENIREGWREWLNRGGIVGVTMLIHKGANAIGWKI